MQSWKLEPSLIHQIVVMVGVDGDMFLSIVEAKGQRGCSPMEPTESVCPY